LPQVKDFRATALVADGAFRTGGLICGGNRETSGGMKRAFRPFVVVGLGISWSAGAAWAAEWPQFRGPDGQGKAPEAGPLKWGVEEGVAWKTEVPGSGWASPVIADGKLLLLSAVGDDSRLVATAYNTADGKLLWEREVFKPTAAELLARHSKNSLASATPVLAGGVAYVHFGHMGTAALKLEDGEVLWRRKIAYKPVHGSGSSPVLADDKVILNIDGETDPMVVALDRASGEIVWQTKRDSAAGSKFSFSTPLLVDNGGRSEVVSPGSGMVGAYSPADGSLLWKVSYGEGFSVVPRPVVADGLVYVATGFMRPKLLAIRMAEAKGDVTASHVEWEAERQMPKTPSVIVDGGRILTVDDTGRMNSLDARTGEVKWSQWLQGNFSASPILAAGKWFYALTEDGVAYVVEISEDEGKIVHEVDMNERLFASPAIVDGALYLRSESALWKITGN